VLVAAVAAGLSFLAACQANSTADSADATANALRAIEEERHLDERLEDLVAAQVVTYFSLTCDEKKELWSPDMGWFYDNQDPTLDEVYAACDAETDSPDQRFVLHEVNVVGTPAADHVNAIVDRGIYDIAEDHGLVGVTTLEVVLEVPEEWEGVDDAIFPITSITETVEETD
jgi:hypothetical protein